MTTGRYMVRCDIEGVSGVVSYAQAEPGQAEYEVGLRLFRADLVACVEGLLEVLNKSMPNSDPVVVDKEKEVDVLPDQKMAVRDLSDENKKMIRDILSEISDLRKDIWEQMERQREEIKKHVEEQRARDKEMVQQQKDQDKQNVEDQKARDRAMIGEIKGETDAKRSEAISAAKDKMDAAKNVDLGGAKPAIEKQKIDKSGFKPDMNVKPQQ